MNARLRQVLISTSIILVVALLAGATYQGVATALERRRYPHPGKLVDVGGHQLHIYCTGEGSPTVVLEAPATGLSAAWARVQPEIARRTRVCSYDRSGLGWSEAGDKPYDPGRVPEELHALLTAAKEPGPYVLVGYALGASFARRFASLYPGNVAGLVLIDPAAEPRPGTAGLLTMSPWLARAGVLRAAGVFSDDSDELPGPAGGAMHSFLNRPDHLTRAAREWTRWDDAVRLAEEAKIPPTLPVVTVESSDLRDADNTSRSALNDGMASKRVVAAILDVVTKTRRK